MSGSPTKQWIVLLNKTPRGPFSENDIKELLRQGTLRPNDLGFELPEAGSGSQSSWKFLWQFAEFDSRLQNPQKTPPPAVLEKRKIRSESEIQKEVDAELPLDLKTIQIEDLILKTLSAPKRDFSNLRKQEDQELHTSFKEPQIPSSQRTVFALVGVLCLMGLGTLVFQEVKKTPTKNAPPREISSPDNSSAMGASDKKAQLPTARAVEDRPRMAKPENKRSPEFTNPAARDRGEIREEEILRIREEERRRELEEEARLRKQEEEEQRSREREQEEDEEASESPRKRPRRARKLDARPAPEEEVEEDEANQSVEEEEESSSVLE